MKSVKREKFGDRGMGHFAQSMGGHIGLASNRPSCSEPSGPRMVVSGAERASRERPSGA